MFCVECVFCRLFCVFVLVVKSLFFMLMGGGEAGGGVGRGMEKDGRESNQSIVHKNE